jgi:hypothetical protein
VQRFRPLHEIRRRLLLVPIYLESAIYCTMHALWDEGQVGCLDGKWEPRGHVVSRDRTGFSLLSMHELMMTRCMPLVARNWVRSY